MRTPAISQMLLSVANRAMLLRASVVGANFVVMIGLAAYFGLPNFGALIHLWALALVAAAFIGLGGPMLLLREAARGKRLPPIFIVCLAVFAPAIACGATLAVLNLLLPAYDWLPILIAAFAINLSACAASVMRGTGSVILSMALRDAGPFVALGAAAVVLPRSGNAALLTNSALLLLFVSVAGLIWALWQGRAQPAKTQVEFGGLVALWGAALLGLVIAQMDIVVGGALLPPEVLGAYAVLRRVANLVALPVSVATWIAAPDVSSSFSAGDRVGLARASALGNRIAWYPAFVVFVAGLIAAYAMVVRPIGTYSGALFALLLLGSLLQAFWASGYTVATMTNAARLSASARLIAVATYAAVVFWQSTALTVIGNGLAYVVALSLSSLWLWAVLRHRYGVDTSAAVLWTKRGALWTLP